MTSSSPSGIKCPGSKRMPDAPPRTRPRKEAQSAALPSVKLPERVNANPVQPEDSRDEFRELHGHLSQSAERAPDFPIVLPRCTLKPFPHTNSEQCYVRRIRSGHFLTFSGDFALQSISKTARNRTHGTRWCSVNSLGKYLRYSHRDEIKHYTVFTLKM